MSDDADSDDFLDIELRTAVEVAARMLILHALTQLALIAAMAKESSDSESAIEEDLFDLKAWIVLSDAGGYLTSREKALFDAATVEISSDDLFDFAWQLEALQTLMSACGLAPAQPPWQMSGNAGHCLPAGDAETDTVTGLAAKLQILTDEDGAGLREIYELWHWRAITEQEMREASGQDREELERSIQEVAEEAGAAGLIEITSLGDFASGDRPIRSWSDEEVAAFAIASEVRLQAMNWLCGFGSDWDDVPVFV